MTDDMMSLRALLAKNSDADLLREMIGFAAHRLMELEVQSLTGAAHGERSTDGRPAPGRWNCAFRNCAKAAISQDSWSRAGWPRRR
jgi:hypothetical protein